MSIAGQLINRGDATLMKQIGQGSILWAGGESGGRTAGPPSYCERHLSPTDRPCSPCSFVFVQSQCLYSHPEAKFKRAANGLENRPTETGSEFVTFVQANFKNMIRSLQSIAELEDELSRPTPGVLETLRDLDGDVVVIGAGGKMGPTLAHMVRRGLDEIGHRDRRVIAVSRFSSHSAAQGLQQQRVETISCDLMQPAAIQGLPAAPLVIYMAGQKFGTSEAPELTWIMNTVVPAIVAERYRQSRIVVFSTGCVYPLTSMDGPGSSENDALGPPGEYANSCVGRERVFSHFAKLHGTRMLFFRLCYAIDMRYGVLCDVAAKVANGLPVDVTMGAANVIWQGDANARAIQCLAHTASAPIALNVTGIERVSIRWLAQRFAELLGRQPVIVGDEGRVAWLWDATRSYELFGPPTVSLEELIQATAQWHRQGGATHGKPTHFEVQDGQF